MKARILVVEDERAIQIALSGLLRREGYEVEVASNGEEAVAKLGDAVFDLVLTDLALGRGLSGMEVLRRAKAQRPEILVVMITAHGSEQIAVEAMKAGAEDYVPKPFDNDEIRLVVHRALDRTRLERENRLLLEQVQRQYGFENLIGTGPAMRHVFETLQKVAETDLTVLVRGESGTGKELVAQALHNRSSRKNRPFVAVNCAAISKELVESELFGHEKGAFTGADARRQGRFEAADGGTIFLDEIGDMARETQAKVLRVLQERSFERVGGTKPIPVDVRVVAATHRNLEEEVGEGRFREDLYYRLKVVEIDLPPLRERREDIPALVDAFVKKHCEGKRRAVSAAAVQKLKSWPWKGNARELENVVERSLALFDSPEIGVDDLPVGPSADAGHGDSAVAFLRSAAERRLNLRDVEALYIDEIMKLTNGNKVHASKILGVDRKTLYRRMERKARKESEGVEFDGTLGKQAATA